MDFQALQTEVFARGFEHLNDASTGLTRVKRRINERYLAACGRAEFPFLYATATGNAPLTITDLRSVLSVVDTTNDRKLNRWDRRLLVTEHPDLGDQIGPPYAWYRNSEAQISVYPAGVATALEVRYCKVPAELSANGDTPVIPSRFRWLIVEGAVADLLRDNSDLDDAQVVEQRYETGIAQLVAEYEHDGLDGPDFIQVTDSSTDW